MILETSAAAGIVTSKLIAYGFCLGVGFWLSKKLTNRADEILLKYDKRAIARLSKEMDLCPPT